jgi:hypothetical protein
MVLFQRARAVLYLFFFDALIGNTRGFSSTTSSFLTSQSHLVGQQRLFMTEDDSAWAQQRALMDEMTDRTEKSYRKEQLDKFAERRNGLIGGE